MFIHLLTSSLKRSRERGALAILAIAFGTSVATALLSLSLDVGDKLAKELRSYGANLAVLPSDALLDGVLEAESLEGAFAPPTLPAEDLPLLRSIFWRHNIEAFVPLLETSVTVVSPRSVVPLVGAWFDHGFREEDGATFTTGMREMRSWWKVEGEWLSGPGDSLRVMVGRRTAEVGNLSPGDTIVLEHTDIARRGARSVELEIAGIFETGDDEEARIYGSLELVQDLTGIPGGYSRLLVSCLTTPDNELARKDPKKMTVEE
jgi:putative ABC transport system permease protein